MYGDFVIVPSHEADYVELARNRRTHGRLFRKHILNRGDLLHPVTGRKIKIDDAFVATLKRNFNDGICDIVQVPLANDKNEHVEDPTRNIGEVIDIVDKGGKIYAVIDARSESAATELGKTLLGASAMMHLNYTDTRTGKKVGPTLLHVCVTNRPYVTGLEDYEEIVAATADSSDNAVMLTQFEETKMTLEELLRELKEDHEIDVKLLQRQAKKLPGLQEQVAEIPDLEAKAAKLASLETKLAEQAEQLKAMKELQKQVDRIPSLEEQVALVDELKKKITEIPSLEEQIKAIPALEEKAKEAEAATALSRSLAEALAGSGVVKLSNGGEVTQEDIVGAVTELAAEYISLSAKVEELSRKEAELVVQGLIDEGRILPSKKDVMINLKLAAPETFEALLPEEPLVKMSNEVGVEPPEDKKHVSNIDDEIARLTAPDGPAGRYINRK